ncbi:MAG: hypothetical protein EOP39_04610 [Rubrivivax sp.]|nr:MAG: hypothetical protein EOP39_04610 [Rubrivivax sp.]
MSIPKICALLENRLQALTPAMPTAFENTAYQPAAGVTYQRADHLINNPVDRAITLDILEWRGIFQVMVCAPLGAGRGAAQARAQLIADHFAPPQRLTGTGVYVELLKTPAIASGFKADDRWCVPVSISWSAFRT